VSRLSRRGFRRKPRVAPGPVAEPAAAPALPPPSGPQRWNLWEIERAVRARGALDEEREYLLIYLRDYAGTDGQLPVEFHELVRESFGELLGTPTA
jgi:hypothetical protein